MLFFTLTQLISNIIYTNTGSIGVFSAIKSKFFLIQTLTLFQGGCFSLNFNNILRTALVLAAEYYQIIAFNGLNMFDISLHFSILPFITNLFVSRNLYFLIPIILPLLFVNKISVWLLCCCVCYAMGEVLIANSKIKPIDDMYTSAVLLSFVPGSLIFSPVTFGLAAANHVLLTILFFIFARYSFVQLLPWRVLDLIVSVLFDCVKNLF